MGCTAISFTCRRELRSGALANRGIAMPDFVPIVPALS
jgi:hypothetical protein